jgi:hypothetical protein
MGSTEILDLDFGLIYQNISIKQGLIPLLKEHPLSLKNGKV